MEKEKCMVSGLDNCWQKAIKLIKEEAVELNPDNEDIVKAFQLGMAFGFCEKNGEMDKLIDKIKEMQEEKEWPQNGDYYFYLGGMGDIYTVRYTPDDFMDNRRIKIGNCFKTNEEAEFELERLKVLAEMKKFAEPESREWNGKNRHWIIALAISNGDIDTDYFTIHTKYDGIYFESSEKAKQCVASVGEDRIKKYYLRIKE